MTPQKNPLRPCHQGITFVNDEPTCLHKKRMVRRRSGKTGKWYPTRPAITPPSAGSETVMASGSTSSRVLGRKRPISPDASENSPSKKQQSEPQSSKDSTARLLFPPTPDRRAANESHTNENDPSYVVGEDKLAKRSSEEHASSQTGNGGSGTSPPHVARVPLGDADSNRL
ncbi:hypothetical protein E5D57_013170 [Metarhizium anisopliae]|nr:hypothetical protein E5D57_013170 [Metarhizium anisopliae]